MHPEDTLDFRTLVPGQVDPLLNQEIDTIIIQSPDYIVYLDASLNTQWNIKDHLPTPGLGAILNRISKLESKSDFVTYGKWQTWISHFLAKKLPSLKPILANQSLKRIRCLLGEAIARIFDGNEETQARSALDEAERIIAAMNAEYSRKWYFQHAQRSALLVLVLALTLWLGKSLCISLLGQTAFEIAFCSLFGAVGAYVFVARRGEKIELDAMSGAMIHRLEADARLTTGIVSAAVLCLAIKAHLLFSSVTDASQLTFMIMVSILAGYSEKIIPNMVKKIETGALDNQSKKLKSLSK